MKCSRGSIGPRPPRPRRDYRAPPAGRRCGVLAGDVGLRVPRLGAVRFRAVPRARSGPGAAWFARWHGWLALSPRPRPPRSGPISPPAGHAGASLLIWVSAMAGVAAAVGSPLKLWVRATRGGRRPAGADAAAMARRHRLRPGTLGGYAASHRHDRSGRAGRRGQRLAVLALQTAFAAPGPDAVPGLGLAQSAAAHLVLFGAVFAALSMARAVAELTSAPAQWEAVAAVTWLATLAGAATALVLVPALSVSAGRRGSWCLSFGAVMAVALAARGFGSDGRANGTAWCSSRRVAAALGLTADALGSSRLAGGPGRRLLAARGAAGAMDSNFAVAKLGAVAVGCWSWPRCAMGAAHVRLHPALPYAACAACRRRLPDQRRAASRGPVTLDAATRAADALVVGDPSFRTLRDWLHPPVEEAVEAADCRRRLLRLPPGPHQHRAVGGSGAGAGTASPPSTAASGSRPPHVFVFVIDSLRRDYVSPYNRRCVSRRRWSVRVESVVFERAFTRYGATGLSVPSIWVGGIVPHKQYPALHADERALRAPAAERYAAGSAGQHRRGGAWRAPRPAARCHDAASRTSASAPPFAEMRSRLDPHSRRPAGLRLGPAAGHPCGGDHPRRRRALGEGDYTGSTRRTPRGWTVWMPASVVRRRPQVARPLRRQRDRRHRRSRRLARRGGSLGARLHHLSGDPANAPARAPAHGLRERFEWAADGRPTRPTSRRRCMPSSGTTPGRRRQSSAGRCSGRGARPAEAPRVRPGGVELRQRLWVDERHARDLYISDGVRFATTLIASTARRPAMRRR